MVDPPRFVWQPLADLAAPSPDVGRDARPG